LLGGPGTLRRILSMSVLIVLGVSVAYVEIDHASQSRNEQARPQGAVVSDMAVPEPLLHEAEKRGEGPVFTDFSAYEEFLLKHELAEGVFITRVCSMEGDFLYHAFPPLRDRDNFSVLVASLPDLVAARKDETAPLHRIHFHALPAKRLPTRSAAEDALDGGVFPSLRRNCRDSQERRTAEDRSFPRPSDCETADVK
jgi:hypothetical protein